MADPRKVLFVCSLNKFRSYTAEEMYRGFDRYQVRSRGTENSARRKITAGDIGWADVIFTMEKQHTERLRSRYEEELKGKQIITLFLKDLYPPMHPKLIALLREKLAPHLALPPV